MIAGGKPLLVHNNDSICPERIDYASDPMSSLAFEARQKAGISAGRNVGVAHVPGWNDPRTGDYVVGFSKGAGYHSENHILDQLSAKGFDPKSIKALYSERSPCGECQPLLDDILEPGTRVTYSVPHGPGSRDLLQMYIDGMSGRR